MIPLEVLLALSFEIALPVSDESQGRAGNVLHRRFCDESRASP